jgi:hypothetical protein
MISAQEFRKIGLFFSAPLMLGAPAAALLAIHYTNHSPSIPNPVTGNVVPFNDHGTYLYITQTQDLLLTISLIVGLVGLSVTVILGRWKPKV